MDAARLMARYDAATRILEFELSEAPLVDAVEDVAVLSISGVPCAVPGTATEPLRGLFCGRDAFLFNQPFVFASEDVTLMCWLRLRDHSASSLHVSAAALLGGGWRGDAPYSQAGAARHKDYVVVLSAIPADAAHHSDYLYFSTPLPFLDRRTVPCVGGAGSSHPVFALSAVRRTDAEALFFCSAAAALCFEC